MKKLLLLMVFISLNAHSHALENQFENTIAYLVPKEIKAVNSVYLKPKVQSYKGEIKLNQEDSIFMYYKNNFKILDKKLHLDERVKKILNNKDEELYFGFIDGLEFFLKINQDFQNCKYCVNYKYDDDTLENLLTVTPKVFELTSIYEVPDYIVILAKKMTLIYEGAISINKININNKKIFVVETERASNDSYYTDIIFSKNEKVYALSFKNISFQDDRFLDVLQGIRWE